VEFGIRLEDGVSYIPMRHFYSSLSSAVFHSRTFVSHWSMVIKGTCKTTSNFTEMMLVARNKILSFHLRYPMVRLVNPSPGFIIISSSSSPEIYQEFLSLLRKLGNSYHHKFILYISKNNKVC